ncbi:MAG: sialic acid synthase SpsE, partial [Flavobacteriales bacterium]
KEDMKHFNSVMDKTFELLGSFKLSALESEEKSRQNARRSLVAAREIPKGKVIDREDLTWKRPAKGISPKEIDVVLGMKAARTIDEDEILMWNALD